MKRYLLLHVAVLALMLGNATAPADTVTSNSSLTTPDDFFGNPAHAFPTPWYFNSNSNTNFTVDTGGGTAGTTAPGPIEIGLRASNSGGPVTPQSPNGGTTYTNIYDVQAGSTWNYDFSIDLRPGDIYGLSFKDVAVDLAITDTTSGQTTHFDPTTHWTDQKAYGASAHSGNLYIGSTEQTGDWGAQDSKSLSSDGSLSLYNINATDLYTFTLTVTLEKDLDSGSRPDPWPTGTLLASDTMKVQVVNAAPLPPALWSGLGLLACLGLFAGLKNRSRLDHFQQPS